MRKNEHNILQENFQSRGPDLIDEICEIIEKGQKQAYSATHLATVLTYWNVGRRIVEKEQSGNRRADYEKHLINLLAEKMSIKYGNNYTARRLRNHRRFYLCFKNLDIWHSRVPNITWTHFRRRMTVPQAETKQWCVNEISRDMWNVRTPNRNISTQYDGRMCVAKHKGKISPVMEKRDNDTMEYIKTPVVAEFLGFKQNPEYPEKILEQALIEKLEHFITYLGHGFAFVKRQKHVVTQTDDFHIDLVFYNFKMKQFVLFELKPHQLSDADVGQLDMHVRMYDDLVKDDSDNPTTGVLLCTDTDTTIAKYSVLYNSKQLFASEYMAYMTSEEELCREIEGQKRFFIEQHGKENMK